MAMRIYHKTFNGTLYYYAQRSFREKIDPGAQGKTKGSGKSHENPQRVKAANKMITRLLIQVKVRDVILIQRVPL